MRPSPLDRSLRLALILLGVSSAVLGGALMWVSADPDNLWGIVAFTVVFWIYLAAGIVAWWRRPGNRFGVIVVGGGFAVLAGGLVNTAVPVLIAIGMICGPLILAVLVHLLLAFPLGRLRGRAPKAIVITAYVNSLVLQAPSYLFVDRGIEALYLTDLPGLASAANTVQEALGFAIFVATSVVLLRRLRGSDKTYYRVLLPLVAYGVFAVPFLPLSTGVLESLLGVTPWARGLLQLTALAGFPIVFALTAGRLNAFSLDRKRLIVELHASERALAETRELVELEERVLESGDCRVANLTTRQREVLALVAQGRSNLAIARELVLTEKSVSNHISRIFDALELPVAVEDNRRVLAAMRFLGQEN